MPTSLSFTVGETPIESYRTLNADCINRAHKKATSYEKQSTALSFPICHTKLTILTQDRASIDFSDFAKIIANVNDKTRVGVSLDISSCKPMISLI